MHSENTAAPPLHDEAGFAAWLAARCVPVAQWGTGNAKTIGQLLAELRNTDCWLTEHCAHSPVVRNVRLVQVTVTTRRHGRILRLVEDHQRFRDGRERRRRLDYSLGEKLTREESAISGAVRALREELGIIEPIALQPLGSAAPSIPTSSPSYPGLATRYEIHQFACELPSHLVLDSYTEEGPALTTEFRWVESG